MKLQSILQGFSEYLERQKIENGDQYQYDTLSLDVNIYAHAKEFKKYISEELNIFQDIQSMSIGKILSMEVKNGQLVNPDDETEEEDLVLSEEAQDGIELLDEIAKEESKAMEESSKEVAQDAEVDEEVETTEEVEVSEDDEQIENEENLEINEENNQEDVDNKEENEDDLEAEETQEIKETEETQDEKTEEEASKENEEAGLLVEILNNFLQDENVITALDTDKDGSLSKEEITSFLKAINEFDSDSQMFSLDDIFSGMEQIEEDGTFVKENVAGVVEAEETEETEKLDEAEETKEAEKETKNETKATSSTPKSSSSGASRSSGGGTSISSNGRGSGPSDSYENMSEEQLKQELTTANTESKTKQEALTSILNGTDERVKAKDEEVENLYTTYQDELKAADSAMAKEVDTIKQDITAKEQEISSKEQEIVNQEIAVSNSQTTYNSAVATRQQLEASLSELENADTSKMSSSDIADLETKKEELTAKINEARNAEKTANETLQSNKATLENLNTQKQTLEDELSALNEQKTELDTKIVEKYPQIKDSQDAYNNAKNEGDKYKAELATSAKNEVQKAQEKINKINSALNALKNKETAKEYSLSPLSLYNEQAGEKLIQTARQMLGQYGSSTGYCAAGVSRTIKMAYGISMSGNGNDWDTNMEELERKGLFVEATKEFPTVSDFDKLPAGAIVCWEDTGGFDGGGAQYGHVCVADGNGGEISDHYEQHIILSVGGRSDQYRIFLPT